MIVCAENLTKKFGMTEAVRDISFVVPPGECFGILGPNGAGKTTTTRMIYGASPWTSGSLTVFGMDARRQSRQIKAALGVVPQENNLDPDLTVLENLLVYARYFGIPKAEALRQAESLLQAFQLENRARETIFTLSGGMRRRLTLARALINRPRLLLLDEPTTGLDPQARRLIWQRLRNLREAGTTIVLTTHYMEDAEQVCSQVAIMDAGRIILQGDPARLVREVVGTECYELEPAPGANGQVLRVLEAASLPFHRLGDTYYIFPDSASPSWQPTGLPHRRLLHRRATLEDLFLKLTGRELGQ